MQFTERAPLSSLVNYIIASYFSQFSSVLIVYDSNCTTALQHEYLHAVSTAFASQSQRGQLIGLQWIDVAKLKAENSRHGSGTPIGGELLMAADRVAIEGFITILSDTEAFLHSRYYATRYSKLRLKDKRYLFLCEHENPKDLLATEILQFYPNHLMIVPSSTAQSTQEKWHVKQTAIITTPTTPPATPLPPLPTQTPRTTASAAAEITSGTATPLLTARTPSTTPGPSTMLASTMAPKQTEIHKITTTKTLNIFRNPFGERAGSSSRIPATPKPTIGTTRGIAAILTDIPGMSLNRQNGENNNNCHYHHHHGDINFELWTQKFVGDTVGNLDALLLGTFLANETFVVREDDAPSDGTLFKSIPVAAARPQHKQRRVQLYPDKLSNLGGRPLLVGTITYIPYVVTNYVAPGEGHTDPIETFYGERSVFWQGSEAQIVRTFCQVRNCHLLVRTYGIDNWGFINWENETSDGLIGDLYQQRFELAIGCIYNWYNNITETSHTIARSSVTLLGPAPTQFPKWYTNLMPFTSGMWFTLILSMLVCTLVFYTLKWLHYRNSESHKRQPFPKLSNFNNIMLDTFATFIQQPSAHTQRQRSWAGRIFWSALLSATITIENTYSGQLKSLLTVPLYMEPVDTIAKWTRQSWQWGAPSDVWVQSVVNSDIASDQNLVAKFQTYDYEYLYNATYRSDFGIAIERLMSGGFSFGNFLPLAALDSKIILKDDLYLEYTRAVSIRGWPLMDSFNRHIRTCLESGLFMYWERQTVAQYLDRKTEEIMLNLAYGHVPKMPPQKLTVANIWAALFLLLIGYIAATVAFVMEVVWYKYQATKALARSPN